MPRETKSTSVIVYYQIVTSVLENGHPGSFCSETFDSYDTAREYFKNNFSERKIKLRIQKVTKVTERFF